MSSKPRIGATAAPAPAESPPRIVTEEAAYDGLREALMAGAYLPGEKLSIRRLAAELNASVMPVRTALRRLASERALDVRPSGTATVPRLSQPEFTELTALRLHIEPLAVEMAAPRLSKADFSELRRIVKRHQAATAEGDPEKYLRADRDFLLAIYRRADAPLVLGFIETMWMRRGPLFWEARWMLLSHRERAKDRHEQIAALLEAGKVREATQALRGEIQDSAAFLLEHVAFA